MTPTRNTVIDTAALIALLEKEGPVVLLESQSEDHPEESRSYLAARPRRELWVYGDEILEMKRTGCRRIGKGDPWKALKKWRSERGGWLFGYLGYDLKNHSERLYSRNPDRIEAPDLWFMEPGLLIAFGSGEFSVLEGTPPRDWNSEKSKITSACSIPDFRPQLSASRYCGKIRRAQREIREGEYYEINLSHQMTGTLSGPPFGLYRSMKAAGPVPFGAYISFGEWKVCCASPERFLAKRDRRVFSQPMKGTIGRGSNADEDATLKKRLHNSEKNRAENLMIIDLVRNDLGRIARNGTVKVPTLFEVQTFGTVHQMVSTVEAETEDDEPVEILRACFPMGSMTGAPKIRAMKSIEKLEDYRRGIYSGAIGYIDPEGDFDFNVVIRTAVIRGERLYYSAGGAITGDSDPREEWEETMIKAKALTSATMGPN